jgi:hypothetical protein
VLDTPEGSLVPVGSLVGSAAPRAATVASRLADIRKRNLGGGCVSTGGATAWLSTRAPGDLPPQTLLSASDSKACLELGLPASTYISCKRLLVVEACTRATALTASDAQAVLAAKLDRRRAEQLFDYCVRSGWLAGWRTLP